MYSRYTGYRPFVPLDNMLSRSVVVEEPLVEVSEPTVPLAAITSSPPQQHHQHQTPQQQKSLLDGLLGGLGGGKKHGHHSQSGGMLGNLMNGDALGGIAGLLRSGGGGISKLLKNFSIEWDSGDILLALILLFMSLESDDDEILILLGLMLVMGF